MILLSKENCSQCNDFKNFLNFTALGKKHASNIEILTKGSSDEAIFNSLLESAKEQGATSYPILLDGDRRLLSTGFNAGKVITIFKELP